MQIVSFSPFGYEGALVNVEVDLRRGIPAVDIVGLADGAVKESRERMRSAIRNSGFEFPPERVLISLSPADLRKEGAGFDLAVALAVLGAKGQASSDAPSPFLDQTLLVMGELELNGRVRPVRGIHAAVSTAHSAGIRLCIVPSANAEEAREVSGMRVFGADNLREAFTALADESAFSSQHGGGRGGTEGLPEACVTICGICFPPVEQGCEFKELRGQQFFVRGLQIAAAGGHNLLAFGPPGCGKTLGLQKFPALLPLLTMEEAQPVTRIYSIAGLLPAGSSLIRTAPFRQPHQTATIEGICGGGIHCTPGEISLAHNGVLFLDEAAEFKTSVLQMLRVPLESGNITLSRAGRTSVFPASFQLLMATNPCPCGNYGSQEKLCLCSARAVEQYWKKFSAPLLDRVDIRIQVERNKGCSGSGQSQSTAELREAVAKAVAIQRKRQGKRNARLMPGEIAAYCKVLPQAQTLLDGAAEKYNFSPRAVAGCLKVARTIADMNGTEMIGEEAMKEAVSYRKAACGLEIGFGML